MKLSTKLLIFLCFIITFSYKREDKIEKDFVENISASEYEKQLKELYFKDQSLRRVLSVIKRKCKSDSVFSNLEINRILFNSVINEQDSLRSLKFLELIQLYGYPDEKINSENIAFYTIFVHSPTSLHERIDSVLKSSNIPKKEYEAIKWHLNGRKGMPIFINGMKYYTDEAVFNYFNKN